MRHRGNILVLVAGIGLTASYSIDGASADARRGQALAEEWCSSCHAVAPNAARNPAAPAFAEIAAEPSATEYGLRVFLRTPHATMPNFVLKPNEIDDIVSYIRALRRHW